MPKDGFSVIRTFPHEDKMFNQRKLVFWYILRRVTLREKCPNTVFFLVRIFLYLFVSSPEKTPYLDTFHVV